MFAFLWSAFCYCTFTYGLVRLLDLYITECYVSKINSLLYEHKEDFEEEPSIDPLYNVKNDVAFLYYRLDINPAWHIICNAYFTYTYYHTMRANLADYILDDY